MSRFYVGQRVRLVGAKDPRNVGLEGVILYFEHTPKGKQLRDGVCTRDCDVVVTYDDDVYPCVEHTSLLEPITDSYDKVEWSECLWRPTQSEVTA